MKPFKLNVSGYEVTDTNYKDVVNEIYKKHGICPAINTIVTKLIDNQTIFKVRSEKIYNQVREGILLQLKFNPIEFDKYFEDNYGDISEENIYDI